MNKDLKPERYELPDGDERTILRERIIKALNAVPIYFKSPINIKGLAVTDLFSMNTLLGGAIEDQTTQALNDTRNIWDPDGKYSEYFFKRYSESFSGCSIRERRRSISFNRNRIKRMVFII